MKWASFWFTWSVFFLGFDVCLMFSPATVWSGVINGSIQFVCAILWYFELKEKLAA